MKSPPPTTEANPMLSLGIDPGPVNTGLSVTSFSPSGSGVVLSTCLNFQRLSPFQVREKVLELCPHPDLLTIERFVSYRGVQSDSTERTGVIIGAIASIAHPVTLIRAVDWKFKVVQYLSRQGFKNPSQSLDKKFSLAAAEFASGGKFKTDHEADSFLLSLYGYVFKKDY